MKILFPYMARWYAVNWTRYHSLLTALADAGHVIHVLQPPPLQSAETNFQEIEKNAHPNIVIHDVALSDALWNVRMPFDKLFKKAYYSAAAYRTAQRLIREHDIGVVLLYNIPQYRFLFLPNVKIIFDYADDYVDMLSHELGKWSNRWVLAFAQRVLKKMMRTATVTCAVSNVLATQAVGNVHVVPNGVSLSKGARKTGDPIQGILHDGKPVVGFVGSFEYFIDLDLIVDVARALPQVHFLLVGTGRDWLSVKHRVQMEHIGNVQLTGGVPHHLVFEYIRRMDVCLNVFKKIPVSERACPIKLFEYLSQKKPVVTTRLAELEYVNDDFLFYADTKEEVVDQIQTCLTDKALVQKRVARGFEAVEKRYTWDRIAENFGRLIEGGSQI